MPSSSEFADPVNPQRRGAARTAAESIERYTPVLARPEDWEGIADFVRAGVSAMQPAGPHQAREWMRTLTALTVWAQHEGIPLDREEILAPDTVQRYCEIGCVELDVQSRATRRSVLRRMGRELTVVAPWPETETPLPGRIRHAPYSDREVSRLRALKQPTPTLQRRLYAFLALGLGAGLWAREYLTASGSGLTNGGDVTCLAVTGSRARTVTVRSSFAPTLWRLAEEHPDEPFVGAPDRDWDRARTWHALRYIQTPTDLPLETERLRSTLARSSPQPQRQRRCPAARSGVGDHQSAHLASPTHGRARHDRHTTPDGRSGLSPMTRPSSEIPEPKFRPRSRSVAGQLRYVTAAVDASPHLLAIADALTAKTGRPRNLPFRGFLIACGLHVCIQERNFYRGKIADMIAELTREQRASLGLRGPISYSQIVRASLRLERSARDGLTIDDPDSPGDQITLSLDEVMSYICSAAIPAGMIKSTSVAADGTDFESPARRDERVNKETGEVLPCADPEAILGHRTSTQSHSDSWYLGQEVTVVTNAPDRPTKTRPSPSAPTVVLAAGIRPAGRDRGGVTAGLVLWCNRRQPVSECLVDRGISQSSDENFAKPMREAGIGLVIDLRSEQRKIRTALSDDRVLMINGGGCTGGTPEGLYKDLPVTKLQDTNAEKARIHELYDRLLPFLCTPLTSLGADGRQRFRGPAHKRVRHVRCPNSPRSIRWSRLPKTTCKKGEPCICSTTFTLGPEDEVKIRQRDLWMSTDWYASYARRNASETGISLGRHHFGSLNRMFTQVRHRAGQGIAAAFSLFGTNLRSIQAWHDSRGLDDPWMVDLAPATGEVSDHPRLPRANRKKPKQSLMRRRASGTDPPPATAPDSE